MPTWISVFTGILVLLLTAIGGLVLGRLVFMSKQINEGHKEYAGAIQDLWEYQRNREKQCSELHLTIARDIGALQEKTAALTGNLETMKKDFWDKADRITLFGNDAKGELHRRIDEIERKITAIYLDKK